MQLILLRHADAASADGYADDALRPLTKKGRQVQEQVARALRKTGCAIDRVLCSPRLRAYETAEITARVLGLGEPEEHNVLDGGYSTQEFVDALVNYPRGGTILCVGHEPDMSTWAGELLAPKAEVQIHFRKSALLGLAFDGSPRVGRGVLEYFYRARDLRELV